MQRDWGLTRTLVDLRPDWSVPVFEVLGLPGDLIVVVLVLGLAYLTSVWHRRHATDSPLCSSTVATTIAIVFGGLALVVLLEAIVGAGRPPADWHAIDPSPHGFPSGHTMAATVLWGTIALRHWPASRPYRIASVGLVVGLVALSRLVLGVHYLPDVLAAIGIGTLYLVVMDRSTTNQPPIAFGIALVIALAALLVSGFGSRAILAFLGTAGAAAGWIVTEHHTVRPTIRSVLHRITP